MKQRYFTLQIFLIIAIGIISCNRNNNSEDTTKGYVAGDFHQHTTYSGGDYSIGHVFEASDNYGLDWWSNSDHGGTREFWGMASGDDLGTRVNWESAGIQVLGDPQDPEDESYMWRWQSLKDYSFKDVVHWRKVFSEKLILQAFEWNVPGHQHANVSIIANQFDSENENCDPLAQFEYMFDDDDKDISGGKTFGWEKSKLEGKEKALEAVRWLQANYPIQAYVVPSHPDKSGDYLISDFRDFNNIAPDVCFGFDGMPGHQKNSTRGGYDLDEAPGIGDEQGATFGGAGIFASKIGGLWDALLSEGRHWWISASSDYHSDDDFYPGEYQKTYTFVKEKNNPQELINGLHSGNTFIVTGGLITDLNFQIGGKSMGQTYEINSNIIKIVIEVYDPDDSNFNTYSNYTNPKLDHIDLIAGKVTGLISPESPAYSKDNVTSTKVIARFDATGKIKDTNGLVSTKWNDTGNGWKKIEYEMEVDGDSYFRLRGTNHAMNAPGETDGAGNPLADVAGENNAAKAFSDVWFYSNPVFVNARIQ